MKSIEQLYNLAKRTYILRLTLFTIIPLSTVTFITTYFISNNDIATLSIMIRALLTSVIIASGISYITIITAFRKAKVLKHYNLLYKSFANADKSLLLLISLYLIQNKKTYSLEKPHFFNKQIRLMSKSFGIKYDKEKDEEIVKEILIYSKNINFEY